MSRPRTSGESAASSRGDGHFVASEHDADRVLLPDQLFKGRCSLPGEVLTVLLHVPLVAGLVPAAHRPLAVVVGVVVRPLPFVEHASPDDEQAQGVRVGHGHDSCLVVVEQPHELEEVRDGTGCHLVFERRACFDDFEEAFTVAGKDCDALGGAVRLFGQVPFNPRHIGAEGIEPGPTRQEGLLNLPQPILQDDFAFTQARPGARRLRAHVEVDAQDRQLRWFEGGKERESFGNLQVDLQSASVCHLP